MCSTASAATGGAEARKQKGLSRQRENRVQGATTNIERFSAALRAWTEFVLRHRGWTIGILVLVSTLAASQLGKLRTEVDLDKVLPQSDPYVATANHVREVYGVFYSMLVGVSFDQGTICDAKNVAALKRIQAEIEAHTTLLIGPRVLSVASPQVKDIRRIGEDIAITDLSELMAESPTACKEALNRAKDVEGLLFDQTQTRAMFLVEYADKQGSYRDVVDAIKAALEKAEDGTFRYQFGGNVAFIAETERYANRVPLMLAAATLIISVMLYLAFGSLQGVFIPLLTAILATLWSLGLLGVFRVAIDAFSSMTPILILVVAAGHSVQLLKRFQEEFEAEGGGGKDAVAAAVIRSLAAAGPATVAAGLAAALGFASLVTFDIVSIQIFGLFTAAGIASSIIIELTLIPVLRAAIASPKVKPRTGRTSVLDRFLSGCATLAYERPRTILVLAALIAMACAWAASTVSTDNSVKRYFSPRLQVYQDDKELNVVTAGTNYLTVVVRASDGKSLRDPEVLALLAKLDKWLLAQPNIGQVYGVHRLLGRMHANWGSDLTAHAGDLPTSAEEAAQLLLLYSFSDAQGLSKIIDADYQEALLMVYVRDDSTESGAKLLSDLQDWSQRELAGLATVRVSGTIATAESLNREMVSGKIANLIQLAAAIAIVAAIIFQSTTLAMVVLAPLVVAALSNFAALAAIQYPLNVPASLSTAMAVGVGADYAIYLLMRILEERASGAPIRDAIEASLQTAGRAIAFVAASIAAGYSVLLLSLDFYPHSLLGGLISISMITAFAATILIIPASTVIRESEQLSAR